MSDSTSPQILAFATKGAGSNEEQRIRALLGGLEDVEIFPFDRSAKMHSARQIIARVRQVSPSVVVMEGTGLAGGLACIAARLLTGARYIVSSGDAVGPWVGMHWPMLGPLFGLYERLLCRFSSGFIGWTPYLAGRALTFGAPRAMTAPGWAGFETSLQQRLEARQRIRKQLGIAPDAIVFGIVGSLVWTRRIGYCYGMELARAISRIARTDICALIVGGGTGLVHLKEFAGTLPAGRMFLPGEVPAECVPDYLAAMDVGSLPQSVDRVGSFRYTTKISEYLAANLPIVTGEIPLSYDLSGAGEWLWRLRGDSPWDARYINALADLMYSITADEIQQRRVSMPAHAAEFDRETQVRRTTEFLSDILDRLPHRPSRPRIRRHVKSRRRLLSIAHSYVVSLNRRLVHEMAAMGKDRWEITAVAPSYFHGAQDLRPLKFEPLPNESVRVEVIPARLTRFVHVFSYSRKLKEILKVDWDFVHAWEEPYIWVGGQIARWTPADIPIVYRTAQSLNKWYPPPFNFIERYSMERAAGWICSGTLVAQTLGARQLYSQKPMRLIPLGVDANAFRPDRAAGEAVLRKLNWEINGPPVIGYLGRFTQAKGLPLLMSVLSDLNVPWRALFVGAGPLENELRSWASNFPDKVRICTDVRHDQVPAYLNAMDMLAAPSQTTPTWREQFGRMLIEAFAAGVPVVGSDSGEIPFVIKDTGVVVPERDENAWTHAFHSLLSNPQHRSELANAARARVHDEFAWPAIARRYLEFFDEFT